jgi:hypothetical protein
MPLTPDDYATLEVISAVFHDLPKQLTAREAAVEPTLSEAETPLDEPGRQHIRAKLLDTLLSPKAYSVNFSPDPTMVSDSVRDYVNQANGTNADFIERSRLYAQDLFDRQGAVMSAGLLCVVACTVNRRRAVALMKIEREEGAQLELSGVAGARTFTLAMLDNLVFTKNTKLFKAGLFAKIGPQVDSIAATASDVQLGTMARYWLEFLGCQKEREPRVDTKSFFETVVQEVNRAENLTPLERYSAYEALLVEMRSRRRAVNVPQFIRDHLHTDVQAAVRNRLQEVGVANHFDKDTADIKRSLRRKVLRTKNDIHVIVPQDSDDLVEVEEESLTVHDVIVRVGRD